MSTITISSYTANPPVQLSADSLLECRGWYTRDFIGTDGVTPVFGNATNGEQGPYYSTTPTLNPSGDLTVPAHDVQITVGANPTANYFEGLWVDGAFTMWLMPNTQGAAGWQIPSVYGDPIAYDEIATYNRAKRLVYPPDTYFTATETIQEIERLAGNFDYMAVGVNGIGQASVPPLVASAPQVLMANDPRVLDTVISVMGSPYYADNTGTSDAHTAIQNAIDAADSQGGGFVFIPQGLFKTTASLEIPQYVTLMCSGIQASRIWYQGTDYAVKMGNSASSYTNGMGLRDCEILLANTNGRGVYMLGGRLSRLDNVYIEGVTLGNGRGVVVESSILSKLDFVHCSHIKNGFKIMGSAPFQSTTITLDCCHVGESSVVAGSVGLEVDADSGESTCQNSNFENMDTAISTITGHGMRYISNRFESIGTWAVDIGTLSYGNVFDSNYGMDVAKVRNNSGAGFNSNMFRDNIQTNGTPYPDLHVGASTFLAFTATDRPILATGFPGQSVDILTVTNSSNTTADGVNNAGKAYTGSGGTPLTTILKGTVTIDPASINGNTFSSQAFTLTGAVVGDSLILNPPTVGLTAGILVTQAFVSAANQITVCFFNTTGAPIDIASASWTYQLIRA